MIDMTHDEQRLWLIEHLMDEDPYYKQYAIPQDAAEQKDLLRALMNVREPKPIDEEFIKIQDDYLTVENKAAGVTDIDDLSPISDDGRIYLWQGDITTLKVDAIVNPANNKLCGCFRPLHNCADNIIHSKSGMQLRWTCYEMMRRQGYDEPTGQAKITPAYNLPCEYVIHTVGPVVSGRLTKQHEEDLSSCYTNCLMKAEEARAESIALCCISTGVFCFPNERAAEIAVDTVRKYLAEHDCPRRVIFNVYKDDDLDIYKKLL
jgi:O-acetyl-ADP-ribose deacetylase (regulator of RNase III)